MAQKLSITLIDDLDGSPAAETVSLSLDGKSYELDLNAKNAAGLRKALAAYTDAARRVGRPGSGGRRRAARSTSGIDPAAVRAWAVANKIKVSERGRIPGSVVAQFQAAGN